VKDNSLAKPAEFFVIFKHSTRCGTSRMSRNLFESEWTDANAVYLINVVESRDASNTAASIFNVTHESPQVLLIQNGNCIFHDSHSGIDASEIISRMRSEPA